MPSMTKPAALKGARADHDDGHSKRRGRWQHYKPTGTKTCGERRGGGCGGGVVWRRRRWKVVEELLVEELVGVAVGGGRGSLRR